MVREDKRKQIIKSAYKVFSQKGYENASIKDIASEANITPGLIHYYFKNKEELLLSVQHTLQEKYHKQYDDKTKRDVLFQEVLQEIKSRAEKDPDWYRFRYEIYSLGLKNKEIEREVTEILNIGRKSLSNPLKEIGVEEADEMASLLIACFDGLALQKIIDKDFDIDRSYKLLERLITNHLSTSDER